MTAGHDGTARRLDTPIVGRDEELLAIDQVLREVTRHGLRAAHHADRRCGHRQVAAGAGGHRARRCPARVVRGRCLAYGDGITFWPLREMVNEAAAILLEDTPEVALAKIARVVGDADVAARLAAAIGLSRAAFPLHEISWAARKFFGTLAQHGPLIALVDDIHWAEPAFLELLETVLHAEDRADPASVHRTARAARKASRVGRRRPRAAHRAASAVRCRGRQRRARTCSAPPACRPTWWRASSRRPKATRSTSSRCSRCWSKARR